MYRSQPLLLGMRAAFDFSMFAHIASSDLKRHRLIVSYRSNHMPSNVVSLKEKAFVALSG